LKHRADAVAPNQVFDGSDRSDAGFQPAARSKIVVLSEDLSGSPDEGAKKLTLALGASLARQHDVQVVSARGPVSQPQVRWHAASTRTLLSRQLASALRRQCPDVVIYASRRSATFASFLRAQVLKQYCPQAQTVLLGFQTRRHSRWQRWVIRRLRPDVVVVQSEDNRRYLEDVGCRVLMMASGVDVEQFRPVDDERRRQLRSAFHLDQTRPTVLHVGHLAEGRGIRVLAELARSGDYQVILVASTSSAQQAALGGELRAAGVIVLTEYLSRIEQVYQLADCYLFPVVSTNNAIEAPLSVLEALACDLPVVTTRFGGLPRMFGSESRPGMTFVDAPDELIEAVRRQCASERPPVRHLAQSYAWDAVADELIEQLLALRKVHSRGSDQRGMAEDDRPSAARIESTGFQSEVQVQEG
jgi:glycosyltransferase involved in cell wall biosynthesis